MPLFLIERNFAEIVETDPDLEATIKQVNDEIGIQWLFSFLSADKRKTYCLYEAPNPEAIRAAARRLGVPADTIVEVGSEIGPLAAAIAPLREQVGAAARLPAQSAAARQSRPRDINPGARNPPQRDGSRQRCQRRHRASVSQSRLRLAQDRRAK